MKRILAIALVLVMIFCLAACGKDNDKDNDKTTTTKPTTDGLLGSLPTNMKMGVSIADLDALLEILLNADPGLDVKDIYLEFGMSDKNTLLSLGANILGEDEALNLFLGENIVLNAPGLLDKSYGISLESLMELVTSYFTANNSSVIGLLSSLDAEAVAELMSKYYNLLINEIKAADGLTVSSKDGNTVITGTLNSDALAVILVNIIEELSNDDDFFALVAPLMGTTADEFKQSFNAEKPDKAELLTQAKARLAQYELEVKVNSLTLTADNVPMAADLVVSLNQDTQGGDRPAVIAVAYDLNKGTCNASFKDEGTEILSLKAGDGEVDLQINADGQTMRVYCKATDKEMTAYMEQNGEKLMELKATVSDDEFNLSLTSRGSVMAVNVKTTGSSVVGTLTMDGEEAGKVTFDKKVEGTKTTYTFKTLTIGSTSIDFSKAGICFYVDTNASIPATPTYTDISKMSEDELNTVLEKFMTDNADLIAWISEMMPSGESSGESGAYGDEYDDYYGDEYYEDVYYAAA